MIDFLLCALAVLVGFVVTIAVGFFLWATFWIVLHDAVHTVHHVSDKSMEPTLKDGAWILMWKAKKKRLRHGKIVYIPKVGIPRMDGIVDHNLRIIGMPGDVVELNGRAVFLNGRVLDEPYIIPPTEDYEYQRWEVPEDEYFVLGDNRPEADDSRHHGPILKWNVVKVMLYDITELMKNEKTQARYKRLKRLWNS